MEAIRDRRTVAVTGACGFIGSHLVDRLLLDGHTVLGIDCLTDYYDPAAKWRNISSAQRSPKFQLRQLDLAEDFLENELRGASVVFHLAGQPGVRGSWGPGFDTYVRNNVVSTAKLISAMLAVGVPRLIVASSSSVYGNCDDDAVEDVTPVLPVSPYGVSKLAEEQLALCHDRAGLLEVLALRYFTVFGPRQRPDMAFRRFIEDAHLGHGWQVLGDGEQTREFTFVQDVVDATIRAGFVGAHGLALNVGGGERVTLNLALEMIAERVGITPARTYLESAQGDARHTRADATRIRDVLNWEPTTSLGVGLDAQVAWQTALDSASDGPSQ